MILSIKQKLSSNEELKTFLPFYLQRFIFALSKIIMPFWTLYFLNIGFTFAQIGIICSVRSIVSLICEVPTGVFADTKGKKISVVSGYFLAGLTYLMIPLYNNYYYILVVFIVNSFVETLISGSDQAWATELADNNKQLISSYFLKIASVQNFAIVFSPIIGGFVAQRFGFKWLWVVFGVGTIISAAILLFAKKDKAGYIEESGFKLMSKVKEGFNYIFNRSLLGLLIVATFIFFIVEEFTSLVWTPRLNGAGINLQTLGFLFSISALFSILLPLIVDAIKAKKKRNAIIVIASVLFALLLFIAGFNISLVMIAAVFILMNILESVIIPLNDGLFASNLEENNLGATIFSIKSAIISTASIIGAPLAGFVIDRHGFNSSYLIYSVALVIIPIIYIIFFKKKWGESIGSTPPTTL